MQIETDEVKTEKKKDIIDDIVDGKVSLDSRKNKDLVRRVR
jgi:hypothetical protein